MDGKSVQKLHRKQPREHRQIIAGDVICFCPALDKARVITMFAEGRVAALRIIESEERDETVAEREAKMGALRLGSPARSKQRRFASPHRRSPVSSESSTTLREGRAMALPRPPGERRTFGEQPFHLHSSEGPLPRSMKATLGDRQEPERQAWRDVCIKRRNRAALRTRFPLTPDVGDGWFKPG